MTLTSFLVNLQAYIYHNMIEYMPFKTKPKINDPYIKLSFLHVKRRQQSWTMTETQNRKTDVSHILNIIESKAMKFVRHYDI